MTQYLIGIDEVGRGPLAGPMMVGAVAISIEPAAGFFLEGIKDSKKLSKKKREEWSKRIWEAEENTRLDSRLDSARLASARQVKIAIVSIAPDKIDKYGISRSLKDAAAKCLDTLGFPPEECEVMLDGSLYAPEKYRNQQTVIKGDEKIPIISAASIVAKVYRDGVMQKFHKKYPEYGFDRHVGYGTAQHIAAIKKHGLSAIHRKSFCKSFI